MKIKFQGQHTSQEVIESLAAILQMLAEQYEIQDFREIKLNMTLMRSGEDVELMDPETNEIFDVLEVHKDLSSVDESVVPQEDFSADLSNVEGNGTMH